jgi:hypothetical protein
MHGDIVDRRRTMSTSFHERTAARPRSMMSLTRAAFHELTVLTPDPSSSDTPSAPGPCIFHESTDGGFRPPCVLTRCHGREGSRCARCPRDFNCIGAFPAMASAGLSDCRQRVFHDTRARTRCSQGARACLRAPRAPRGGRQHGVWQWPAFTKRKQTSLPMSIRGSSFREMRSLSRRREFERDFTSAFTTRRQNCAPHRTVTVITQRAIMLSRRGGKPPLPMRMPQTGEPG